MSKRRFSKNSYIQCKRGFGFCFSVQNILQKKSANLCDKIVQQNCKNLLFLAKDNSKMRGVQNAENHKAFARTAHAATAGCSIENLHIFVLATCQRTIKQIILNNTSNCIVGYNCYEPRLPIFSSHSFAIFFNQCNVLDSDRDGNRKN